MLSASLERSVGLQLETETHRTDNAAELDPDSLTQLAHFTTMEGDIGIVTYGNESLQVDKKPETDERSWISP